MFCQWASDFFPLALCVCVVGGGGGGWGGRKGDQVQYLSFHEENNRPRFYQ